MAGKNEEAVRSTESDGKGKKKNTGAKTPRIVEISPELSVPEKRGPGTIEISTFERRGPPLGKGRKVK